MCPKSRRLAVPQISRDGAVSVDDASTPLYDVGKGGLSDAWLFNGTGVAGREDIYLFGYTLLKNIPRRLLGALVLFLGSVHCVYT